MMDHEFPDRKNAGGVSKRTQVKKQHPHLRRPSGPLLFLIFIGDISDGVSAVTLVYVDDSKVKEKVSSEADVEKLQADLNKIYEWENSNNMKFSGGKFQVVRYHVFYSPPSTRSTSRGTCSTPRRWRSSATSSPVLRT